MALSLPDIDLHLANRGNGALGIEEENQKLRKKPSMGRNKPQAGDCHRALSEAPSGLIGAPGADARLRANSKQMINVC